MATTRERLKKVFASLWQLESEIIELSELTTNADGRTLEELLEAGEYDNFPRSCDMCRHWGESVPEHPPCHKCERLSKITGSFAMTRQNYRCLDWQPITTCKTG